MNNERIKLDPAQRARAASLLEEMADNGDLESYAFEIIYLEDALAQTTQVVLCGGTAGMVDGCGNEITILEAYRCSDCNEYFHRDCLFKHCEASSYVTQLRANRELIAGWKADISKAVERAEKAESALARECQGNAEKNL